MISLYPCTGKFIFYCPKVTYGRSVPFEFFIMIIINSFEEQNVSSWLVIMRISVSITLFLQFVRSIASSDYENNNFDILNSFKLTDEINQYLKTVNVNLGTNCTVQYKF